MRRREFLRTAAGIAGAVALGGPGAALGGKPSSALRLTILHTNDVHSQIEPMDAGDFAGFGGASARSALIKKLRGQNDHVLLLDAGDMMQGTPYFNLFQGEVEMKVMNGMGYDAATIGNHDFDAGIERLADLTRNHAEFPILNCNYEFANTPMKGLARDYLIKEVDGARIGLLGVGIKTEGLVPANLVGETRYLDPVAEARRVAQRLRNDEKCDLIICLSHINLLEREKQLSKEPGDRDLIREVPELDLVLGGHNHYLLDRPEGHFRDKEKTMGYVAQTGWGGTHLGVIQVDLFGKGERDVKGGGVRVG